MKLDERRFGSFRQDGNICPDGWPEATGGIQQHEKRLPIDRSLLVLQKYERCPGGKRERKRAAEKNRQATRHARSLT